MLWWSLLAPAGALQQDVDRETLCSLADRVVLAVPVAQETVRVGPRSLERRVHLSVRQTLVGAPADDLDLRLPGGTLGALRHHVEDSPELVVGTLYLLFLAGDVLIGGDAGASPIHLTSPEDSAIVDLQLGSCGAD